jgi:hypothetical protein
MSVDPNPFRGNLTPAQANERLRWARQQPEFRAALDNPRHALHKETVEEETWFKEVIAGIPAPPDTTPAKLPAFKDGETIEGRIAALQERPAYKNHLDPGHRAAVKELTELLGAKEALRVGAPVPALPSGSSRSGPSAEIASRMGDKAFLERYRSPDRTVREKAAAELQPFYEAMATAPGGAVR